MTTQQSEALRLADEWQRKTQREADRQNSAYDRYGMGNTPETVDPLGSKMVAELRTQQARITELESQLAQRFDAADVATAAEQGFRDGVASVSAGSASMASYAARLLVAAALVTQAKADEALRFAEGLTAALGPADGESK